MTIALEIEKNIFESDWNISKIFQRIFRLKIHRHSQWESADVRSIFKQSHSEKLCIFNVKFLHVLFIHDASCYLWKRPFQEIANIRCYLLITLTMFSLVFDYQMQPGLKQNERKISTTIAQLNIVQCFASFSSSHCCSFSLFAYNFFYILFS
jgi:hypothetical protein